MKDMTTVHYESELLNAKKRLELYKNQAEVLVNLINKTRADIMLAEQDIARYTEVVERPQRTLEEQVKGVISETVYLIQERDGLIASTDRLTRRINSNQRFISAHKD